MKYSLTQQCFRTSFLGLSIGIVSLLIIPLSANAAAIQDENYVAEISGIFDYNYVGEEVATAGDVNGDGYDDFLIGVQSDVETGSDPGSVYLVYGGEDLLSSTTTADTAFTKFTGESTIDLLGANVAGVGDVNGDGYDDIVLGAYRNDDGGTDAGAAYLIYGQSSTLSDMVVSDSSVVQFTGEAAGDWFGYQVAGAGDVNGDDYDDMLFTAYENDGGGSGNGAVYLVYGQSAKLSSMDVDDSSIIKFSGEAVDDGLGFGLDGVGDVNGDGYDDIMMGTRLNDDGGSAAGAAYLIYGQSSTLSSITIDHSSVVQFTGESSGGWFGDAIAGAGDMNGDGYDDMIVGAERMNSNGAVYIIYGQDTAFTSMDADDSSIVKIRGESDNDRLGDNIAGVGDLNGDGYDDIWLGDYASHISASDGGEANLVFGSSTKLTAMWISDSDIWTYTSATVDDELGAGISGAGDINGDGYADLLVGARGEDTGGDSTGSVFVLYVDTEDPVVSITGDNPYSLECGTTYVDEKATQSDNLDVSLTGTEPLTGSGVVDVDKPGSYTLTYTSTADADGNQATANRTVNVVDTINPVITLNGDAKVELTEGNEYTELGAMVVDSCDDSIGVVVGGDTVDTGIIGTYTVSYTATDSEGNSDVVTRIVTIVEDTTTEDDNGDEDSEVGEEEDDVIEPVKIFKAKKKGGKIILTRTDGTKKKFKPFKGKKNFRLDISANKKYVVVTNSKLVRVYNKKGKKVSQKKIRATRLDKEYYRLGEKKLYNGKKYSTVAVASTSFEEGSLTGELNVFRLTNGGKLKNTITRTTEINNGNAIKVNWKKAKKRLIVQYGSGTDKVITKWKLTKKGKLKEL